MKIKDNDFEVSEQTPEKVREAAEAARRSLKEGRRRFGALSEKEKRTFRQMQARLFDKMNAGREEPVTARDMEERT